jgi:hypothetical protein
MTDITLCDGKKPYQPNYEECLSCHRKTAKPDKAYQSWSDFWNTNDERCTNRLFSLPGDNPWVSVR